MKINFITKWLLAVSRKIFIAGKTQQEALEITAKLNSEGFLATIDILGEHSKSEEEVEAASKEYKQLIEEIRHRGLKTTVSIKLTHLGLELGFGYCFNIVKVLAVHARQNNVGIEFDMEEFEYNSETIEIFQGVSLPVGNNHIIDAHAPFVSVSNRICLQANIKNSYENFEILHDSGHPTRLVRGAYKESSEVSYWDSEDIQGMFKSLIHGVIQKTILNRLRGIYAPRHAIATHDKKIIDHVKTFVEANKNLPLEKNCIEFQLLYGYIHLGRQLLSEGYPVRIYLPYGDDQTALPYILRRLTTPHTWKLLFDWLLSFGKTRL